MSPKPLISIVIPVYNRADIIQRTLDSVLAQTLRPLNVILVDNNSTDNSLDVLNEWRARHNAPDFHITVLSEPMPLAANARNKGLSAVDTEWTMFFDSDDTMTPDHCARAARCITGNPSADIIGWNVREHHFDGSTSIRPFCHSRYSYNNILHGAFATLRYIARTDLFRKAGAWNPEISTWDDIELASRILKLHPRIIHAGTDITVDVWLQEQSLTGTDFSSRHPALMKSLTAMGKNPALKRPLQLKSIILAADYALEDASALSRKLRDGVIRTEKNTFYKLLLEFAYQYRKHGMRGAGRILAFFFQNDKS